MENQKKYKNLFEFLQDHKINKSDSNGQTPTHTRIGEKNIAGGSYYISDDDYPQFMDLYFRDIIQKNKEEYLTEKQLQNNSSPIAVDIDLQFDLNLQERVYSTEHIEDLQDLYLETLKECYQFDENTRFPIFTFEKEAMNRVEEKGIVKDGIHMIFGIQMEHTGQCILRKKILEKIGSIWGDFPIKNTWSDVFDIGVSKGYTNWQLYGSCKPNHTSYRLTKVNEITFDSTDKEIINTSLKPRDYLTKDKFRQLSIRNTNHYNCFYTSNFMETIKNEGTKPPTPTSQMSIVDHCDYDFDETSQSNEISKIKTREELQAYAERFLESISMRNYKLRELYDYTMILPESFYEAGSYAKWIRVGWALKNTSNRLLIAWIVFSAKSSTFNFNSISDLCLQWENFDKKKNAGVTKRSIIYHATQNNPDGAESIRKSTIGHYIDMTINSVTANSIANPSKNAKGCGDYDIAVVLYQMFKDKYICSDVKNSGIWWRFDHHHWVENDCGTSLRKSISIDLRQLYEEKAIDIQNYLSSMDPEDDRYKVFRARLDTVLKIVQRLGQTSDKKNIMTEAKDLFYDPLFYDRLDSNPYLLGCKNGVVDFQEKRFRDGVPEDYITKSTGIDYKPLTSSSHGDTVNELNDCMKKIFVNVELREYMWNHLSGVLIGMPSLNQALYNYIGKGQNGKSVLTDLMAQVLGTYKTTAPISIITQGRGKVGGLAPEIVALKGSRYVVMQEPNADDVIHEGPMKELVSGVEPITARAPYMTKSTTFIPQFALIVCCNQLMGVKTQDHGTWRRLKVIQFDSLFTDNPVSDDPDKPNQFLINRDLIKKFPEWKETMLAMLVERAYQNMGRIPDCNTVLQSSNEYRQQQDHISEYIRDRIIRCQGYNIRKSDLSNDFKQWFNTNVGAKNPTPKKLHEYMDKEYGKNRGGVWFNIKLKLVEESDFQISMEEINDVQNETYDLTA